MVIVQACLNGARPIDYHPALPVTAQELARQGAACIAAGANELHFHPRSADGRESLSAVDDAVLAMRAACPGTLMGVSTGAWIEANEALTRQRIQSWQALPDYASVNLSERDGPEVIEVLNRVGVGVEAGLATVKDAERFISLPDHQSAYRVLIEIEEQDQRRAFEIADSIYSVVESAGVRRPILLHGFDRAFPQRKVQRDSKGMLSLRWA